MAIIGDGVVEGAPGPAADATAGEEAQHDAVARALPAAAGGQARRALPMAAASSSSRSLSAAAGSGPYETPARPWVLLWRILRTDYHAEDDAHARAEVETQAQGQHAAAAAAPDLTLPLALPPQVSVVSAGPGAHPDPSHPDERPLLLFAANLGLLLEFTEPGVTSSPDVSHLMLARHFHTADGHTAATVERVMERPGGVPVLKSLESVVFSSNDMGEYQIAELQVDDDSATATLIYLESGSEEWSFKTMERPLMLDSSNRRWIPHGSASNDGMLWWFDLSWGILSCDASIREADELLFHGLPDDRLLDQATPDIQTLRTITVSQDKLRYVEIDESGTLIMWTRNCIPFPSGCNWIKSYEMRFQELWSGNSYERTRLPRKVPLLSVVCPTNPNLVYFALGQQLFGVNVPELSVAHDGGVYQLVNVPGPPRPASARYVVPWDLPTAIGEGIKSEYSTIADETISRRTQKEDTILAIWRDNLDHAFHQIQNLMQKETKWIIGMDTEFCPQELPPVPWTSPPFGDESYTHMRHSVDEGNLVQVGLAITDLDYPHKILVFEFNIQFDPTTRPNTSRSVAFLRKTNPQLEDHVSRGIFIDDFIGCLSECGVLNNTAVTWITYQGFSDYGYILRGLEKAQKMPDNRTNFLKSVEKLFPKNYDLKTFHEIGCCCDKSERGKANLEALALSLGVERIGTAHTAGSDALLTVRCFSKMVARELAFAPMMKLQGNVFRMAPIIDLPANYDRSVSVVGVDSTNFQRERTVLQNLFPIYGIVSADLKLSSKEEIRTDNYDTACQDLGHMTAVEVFLVISDPRGWPAYGKVWKFNLSNGDNSISSRMLADLLTETGAISNPAVTWISSDVGLFLYLVNVCTTATLPDKQQQLNTLCSGFFPKLFIVPAGPDESQSDPASKVLFTLRRYLSKLKGSNSNNLELRKTLF